MDSASKDLKQDNNKLWHHLCKELSKANTIIRTSKKILESSLIEDNKYRLFLYSTLDSHTRVLMLLIYSFFDKKYGWSLYDFNNLNT